MGRTRPAPPPPDTARAHIERPPRPRAAGSRSAQCGGGARVPGAPRAAPRAVGAGRRGQSGPVSPPPAQVAVITGGWRCARVRLHRGRRRGRKVRGAACGSGLGGRHRPSYRSRVPGRGSRDLDSPPEVSRSLHPSICSPRLSARSPPRARDPIAPSTSAPSPTSRARRWVPSLSGFVCGPSGPATGFSASQGRPLSLHGATPRNSLPAPPPAARRESVSPSPTLSLGTSVSPGFPSLSLSLLLPRSPRGCLSLLGVSHYVCLCVSRVFSLGLPLRTSGPVSFVIRHGSFIYLLSTIYISFLGHRLSSVHPLSHLSLFIYHLST